MMKSPLSRLLWLLPLAAASLTFLHAEDAKPGAPRPPGWKTAEEWKKILPSETFEVMVKEGTERPGTSPLNKEKRTGDYYSAAAPDQLLFRSEDKFDSGTGWPSFTRPASPDAVTERIDRSFGVRTEILDARTGLHLGHVFDDGPPPTGKRYCMNGVALKFIPREGAAAPKKP